ncbi:MAG TPA: lipocalin family protein [Kiritimatiellia bacterium]|nr:lipocalin family protein [Kiritimatiellia bacterium]
MNTQLILFALVVALLSGCATTPPGITPVSGFEAERYLGKWYELARFDHSFERNLSNVTATYSPRADGGIDVLNRGFNERTKRWEEVKGRAYFVGERDVGALKVSFFGPFFGGYNIMELDKENYQYALVCGPNRSFLWVLSRTRQMDEGVLNALIHRANELGFATENLLIVPQDRPDA